MKIYGQLEKAQLENTTSDTASLPAGMVTYRTDQNIPKVSNGTVMKQVVMEDAVQSLSGKTLVAPVLADAITATQIATPSNPSAGFSKIYAKNDGKFYTLDSSGNESVIGSGSGGVRNLITNGSADDTAASIFVPYADTGSRPVDGTGGSPTVTTSVTTSTPLDLTKSFLLTKPASNVQGQGWAVPFSVPLAYRAKSLKISVKYIVNSGTFVAGTSTTDSDVIWYIFDVTNSQLIEPSNIKLLSNSSTLSDTYEATFQTSPTGSNYRLIAHVATTSASAYELKVDDVTVTPQVYVYGTPVTDWQNYTPTGGWTNTTYTGKWRRVGDSMELYVQAVLTGTPTGTLNFALPPGYSIDTTKLNSQNVMTIGNGAWFDTATTGTQMVAFSAGTTTVNPLGQRFAAGNNNDFISFTPTGLKTFTTGDYVTGFARVPIVGWSSSLQVSDSADTKIISFRADTPSGGLTTSNTAIIFSNKTDDTNGTYNSSTGEYTISTSGKYEFVCQVFGQAGAITTSSTWDVQIQKNGSEVAFSRKLAASTSDSAFIIIAQTGEIDLKAGDVIRCFGQLSAGITTPSYNLGARSFFTGKRLSGPSAIAANESVTLKYFNTAGTSIASGSGTTAVSFPTKSHDSHNSWDGTTFRPNSPGKYRVTVTAYYASAAWTGTVKSVRAIKNGTQADYLSLYTPTASYTNTLGLSGSIEVDMVPGDTLTIGFQHNEAAGRNLDTTQGTNILSITKVAN